MENITFNNEHLFIGNLGHSLVVLAFVSALFGAFSFWQHNNSGDKFSGKASRIAFGIHGIAVLGIVISLFAIIYNHYFEYDYAWQHSSLALPTHYMISCFWEGQEGSFLLWLFWQAVLGLIIVVRPNQWRSPVMAVIMLSQAVLSSMLLGIDFGSSYTFGSSPFNLLRDVKPELLELPVMAIRNIEKADYLRIITDGTGLNPLLQNYWMVIHPPTLFFGFATTIIPFAFAIAGLWNKKYKEWMKPALPWALISVMVLGTGIIMGGIWAYESLSFGGYWAWDPVENASLIPWILMIAAVHVMIINRATGQAIIISYILSLLSFILVLYATFLTRSGVLGDTSVHSFTDLGLSRQLLVFLFMFTLLPVLASFGKSRERNIYGIVLFVVLVLNIAIGRFITELNLLVIIASVVLMIRNFNRHLPLTQKEESIYSREFWMFIGSLVLLISATQVISSTSIPVFNKITSSLSWLFNPLYSATSFEVFKSMAEGNLAPPIDAIAHYNRWQLPMAIMIALLTGLIQFFRYRDTPPKKIAKRLGLITIISGVITVGLTFLFGLNKQGGIMIVALLFSAVFAIVGNALFIGTALKFKWKLSGASMAHIGFGMMLIGILVSSTQKHVISLNERNISYGINFNTKETRENILLMKGEPVKMADYIVTYTGDSIDGPNTYYQVQYENSKTGESFNLYPNAQYSPDQGLMPNPDTRHYLLKDIYTHVSSVPEYDENDDKWNEEKSTIMNVGDTILVNGSLVVLQAVKTVKGDSISSDLAGHVMQIAELNVIRGDSSWIARPLYGVKDELHDYNIFSYAEKSRIRFNYNPGQGEEGTVHNIETAVKPPRYIIMKAIVFPYINMLWSGTLVMIFGFFLAILRRRKEFKRSET